MNTKKLTLAGLFLALSIIIPSIFHMSGIPGQVFLPMHIPVILCGFICGKRYGFIVGAAAPLLNTLLTGMPILYPIAVSMVFELAAYGFMAGYLRDKMKGTIPPLLLAMAAGRIVRIAVTFLITVPFGGKFLFSAILGSIFVTSIWGIVIQIVLIPLVLRITDAKLKHN